jgi:leucyl aminopeptidase
MNIGLYNLNEESDFRVELIPAVKDDRLPGLLEQVAEAHHMPAGQLQHDFQAELKEVLPLYKLQGGGISVLIGLGEQNSFTKVSLAFRSFAFKWLKKLPAQVVLRMDYPDWQDAHFNILAAAVNGLMLARYDIGLHKSEAPELPPFQRKGAGMLLACPVAHAQKALHTAQRSMKVASSQMRIFDLVNAPANKKTPEHLATWAKESAELFGYQARVFEQEELEQMGMHALLAVNRGSEDPARFILLEYSGPNSGGQPLIGLVGKGVTFDTGGVSIKPSANLDLMKSDMGGAAAVLGAVEAAARLQMPVRLVAAIPCTDNLVDARSIKPSDVIQSYSGKTIEVIDTDAEGRLLLVDGISYLIRNHQPDYLLDLATLTGSTVRTFGYEAAALFASDEQLGKDLFQAGQLSGERLWQLPLWDEYMSSMHSDVADIKNFGNRLMGGAITAAKFIEFFTEKHPRWAHLDIAGVAIKDSEFSRSRASTGFGLRLLLEFFQLLSDRSSQ